MRVVAGEHEAPRRHVGPDAGRPRGPPVPERARGGADATLNERGPDSFASPSHIWVYIDNTKVGDVQSLAAISTRYVSSVRKVNGIDATARWGIGHSAGVISVMTWPPQDGALPAAPTDSTAHHLN